MKQLIRYLIPLVIGGAVLFYLDVWSRNIAPIDDSSLKDAPVAPGAAVIATTPAVKSGYDYGIDIPSATPTGPYYFSAGEPPKVSGLPEAPLYYGACEPHTVQLTFAPGAENAA